MPKKKRTDNDGEMELEFLRWKNRKLQRELDRKRSRKRKKKDRHRSQSREADRDRSRSRDDKSDRQSDRARSREDSSGRSRSRDVDLPLSPRRDRDRSRSPLRGEGDPSSPFRESRPINTAEDSTTISRSGPENTANSNDEIQNQSTSIEAGTASSNNDCPINTNEEPVVSESELLEILGVDPAATVEYGKDIHPELASRLQHIATAGLTKETRKELNDKYLIPANSIKIGAPTMNPEIKAAVTETVMKRDKGIEARQKQLAAAISGLAVVLNKELESKDKDSNRSRQLMDICRILCDIQHAESVTRRNFAIFSIKKELKEHLVNTKIDKALFGEDLAETLKSAKAVNKSGTELKTKPPPKPKAQAPTGGLNWKSPAPARKQPQQGAARGREAAPPPAPGPAPRYTRNPPHASSSKTSYPPQKQNRRR